MASTEKKAAQVVEEMATLYERYHHKLFFMSDSLINPMIDDLANEIIKKNAPFYMDSYFRIDNASKELDRTISWRRGGLYRVRIGIESGSKRMLKIMNKEITLEQIYSALPNLAHSGIKTTTYWLIGHPQETEEDFQATLELVKNMKDYIWQAECNTFRYYYGSHNADDAWKDKRRLLFPEEMQDMLVFKTYTLDIEPNRKETFNRLFRFINHCKQLGIPNPYSGYEGYEADKRWKDLHKNAVPSVSEIEEHHYCDNGRKSILASYSNPPIEDFNF